MSIASPTVSLREAALRAWTLEQERREDAIRQERIERRRQYRESLRNSIESTLRIPCDLDAVLCPLSDDDLDNDVDDGGFVALVEIDGLTLGLQRRGISRFLALKWACSSCGVEPITDTRIGSLEDLGSLLEYLPTLCRCRHDIGAPS